MTVVEEAPPFMVWYQLFLEIERQEQADLKPGEPSASYSWWVVEAADEVEAKRKVIGLARADTKVASLFSYEDCRAECSEIEVIGVEEIPIDFVTLPDGSRRSGYAFASNDGGEN